MALPQDLTNPGKFTSTYNQSFRDRRQFISPHASQPMYHYANAYDPSHYDGFNAKELNAPAYQNTTESLPPIDQTQPMPQTSALPATSRPEPNLYGGVKPLTGTYSNGTLPGPSGEVVWSGPQGSCGPGGATQPGYGGFSNYDGMAAARAMDEARCQSHIPGYQGFVRGQQFRHGETYGRVTRRCLDVPTSIPLEP